jgi:hypothetical protein
MTTTADSTLDTSWWGLSPSIDQDCALAWGARAISTTITRPAKTPTGRDSKTKRVRGYGFDLLPDRQASKCPPTASAAWTRLLNERILPEIRDKVFDGTLPAEHTWTTRGYTVRWGQFGGYLYLGVSVADVRDSTAIWSGSGPVPAVGDRVHVTINGFGPGVVIGALPVHGYQGLIVLPDKAPEWHEVQEGRACPIQVFGKEVR